jgi:hypothetical protein
MSFYLETVLNPLGTSTQRIMTGIFEVSQEGIEPSSIPVPCGELLKTHESGDFNQANCWSMKAVS